MTGTGKGGRITKEDALKAVENKAAAPAKEEKKEAPAEKAAPAPAPAAGSFSRNSTRKKLSRMRRTIAKRLVSAKNSTAMLAHGWNPSGS